MLLARSVNWDMLLNPVNGHAITFTPCLCMCQCSWSTRTLTKWTVVDIWNDRPTDLFVDTGQQWQSQSSADYTRPARGDQLLLPGEKVPGRLRQEFPVGSGHSGSVHQSVEPTFHQRPAVGQPPSQGTCGLSTCDLVFIFSSTLPLLTNYIVYRVVMCQVMQTTVMLCCNTQYTF